MVCARALNSPLLCQKVNIDFTSILAATPRSGPSLRTQMPEKIPFLTHNHNRNRNRNLSAPPQFRLSSSTNPTPVPPASLPQLTFLAICLLPGCGQNDIQVYRVPKEIPSAQAPAQLAARGENQEPAMPHLQW